MPINLICDECGEKATEGGYKHHYCKKHFKEIWNNDYGRYMKWLDTEHGRKAG